jgi:hypothetical protein
VRYSVGRSITFADLSYRETVAGVKRAAITGGEMKETAAEVIRLEPGARLTESVPAGADRYLFTLTGGATVVGPGASHVMAQESGTRPPRTTFPRRRSAASISSARRPSAPNAPTR